MTRWLRGLAAGGVAALVGTGTAAVAEAEEAECWALVDIAPTTYGDQYWTVSGDRYELTSGLGAATFEDGWQAARLERGDDQRARVAWNKPPARWCAGDPAGLSATATGNFGGFLYDTYPVAAIVTAQEPSPPVPLAGVLAEDALVIRGGQPTELFGTILVSPRPGGEQWKLIARADLGNGQWVGIVYTYDKLASGSGAATTAPTAPPAGDGPAVAAGGDGENENENDDENENENDDENENENEDENEDEDEDEDEDENEDEDEKDDDDDKPSYLRDVNRGWFHIGGGFGFPTPVTLPGGLFELGVGFYTFGFYAGGGFQLTVLPEPVVRPHFIGYVGVHIPTPVFHPMFGFRISGGSSVRDSGIATGTGANLPMNTPSAEFGGQAGFILREFGGGQGFRFMVEPVYALDAVDGLGAFELWFSFAGVL